MQSSDIHKVVYTDLGYHDHHKILFIYFVVFEQRVVIQDFSCLTKNEKRDETFN